MYEHSEKVNTCHLNGEDWSEFLVLHLHRPGRPLSLCPRLGYDCTDDLALIHHLNKYTLLNVCFLCEGILSYRQAFITMKFSG